MPQAPAQTAPLDPEAAYGIVNQRVYAPRFFQKLAHDHGVRPQTNEEALKLLTMASQLRQAYDADQEKQAAANGSLIDSAAAALDARLVKQGGAKAGSAQVERFYQQAAVEGSQDAELAHAVLSLQAAAKQQQAA